MNNLAWLRKQVNISLRGLGNIVNISYTTLGDLEKGERQFRQVHIDALCDFFKVSSDFLLGKSDTGILVELKQGFTSISKDDYINYLTNGELKEYIEFNSVWRIPNDELETKLDPELNQDLKNTIISELNNLSKDDLEKVLKFIKEFIK